LIAQNGDIPPDLMRRLSDARNALYVFLVAAMGKINPHHVHARDDHGSQDGEIVGGRPECGHNLGASLRWSTHAYIPTIV
jgi:hypothetical protein